MMDKNKNHTCTHTLRETEIEVVRESKMKVKELLRDVQRIYPYNT